jgi:flavodoxin
MVKALVIFDSILGNTKKIAETISKELGEDSKVLSVSDFNAKDLEGISLVVVGSPIIGWKPSENMGKFLLGLSEGQLKDIKAAVFDTRIKNFMSGDAIKKISKELIRTGAEISVKPHAFYVKGAEGPLFEGEVEKAIEWAKSIKAIFVD